MRLCMRKYYSDPTHVPVHDKTIELHLKCQTPRCHHSTTSFCVCSFFKAGTSLRQGKTGCCDGNICQLLWQSSSIIWSMNCQYQKQPFFPAWALSESHCLTADGGGAGSGALIRLSRSTSLLNIEIRWSFKISIYFISWHSCIVGARQYTLSQQYHVPKVQTCLLRLWISYRFYKAWHDYAYNLTAKRCLFTHGNS